MRNVITVLGASVALIGCGGGTNGMSDATDLGIDSPETIEAEPVTSLVNPFIGTGGKGWWVGNSFVGAVAPFGMVQAGPDGSGPNGTFPWHHCSGYHATDDTIGAFSHTHVHGTGIPDLGAVGFMPIAGTMTVQMVPEEAHASRFRKETEEATPGYYAVTLDDPGIRVELAATEHAAHHRYAYTQEDHPDTMTVLVDIAHTLPVGLVMDGEIEILPDKDEVVGRVHNQNGFTQAYGGLSMYFAARFKGQMTAQGTWKDGTLEPEATMQEGRKTGAWFEFSVTDGSPVEIQVGISFIDIDQARLNRDAELNSWDLEVIRKGTKEQWEQELSVVRFEGGTSEQREVMATSLYHAFLHPNSFTDTNGKYRGYDGEIHQAEGFTYYSTFSLWDTYRTLHPLLALVQPERQLDMIRSLVKKAEQGGYVPKWGLGIGYTNVMVGTSGDVVIAETYLKGMTDFDVETAYEAVLSTAIGPVESKHYYAGRVGIEDYLSLGYLAYDHPADESVSRTLEFAVNDFALANLAEALGKADDTVLFRNRAENYANLWDGETGYFRPKNADGTWVPDFDPLGSEMLTGKAFTEGNALQYLWMVPHDMAGLMALIGSPETMAERLNRFFEDAVDEYENMPWGETNDIWWITTLPQFYWHGNEPDIHAAYLFLQAGRPDLTQKWLHWITDNLYHTGNNGIPGNDDAGTLAAWYVFTALGFYPIPGSDVYLVGSPIFPRVEVDVAGGTLVVEAPEASGKNIYVKGVTLNGAPLVLPWFRHADISGGGILQFDMTHQPSDWGVVTEGQSPL